MYLHIIKRHLRNQLLIPRGISRAAAQRSPGPCNGPEEVCAKLRPLRCQCWEWLKHFVPNHYCSPLLAYGCKFYLQTRPVSSSWWIVAKVFMSSRFLIEHGLHWKSSVVFIACNVAPNSELAAACTLKWDLQAFTSLQYEGQQQCLIVPGKLFIGFATLCEIATLLFPLRTIEVLSLPSLSELVLSFQHLFGPRLFLVLWRGSVALGPAVPRFATSCNRFFPPGKSMHLYGSTWMKKFSKVSMSIDPLATLDLGFQRISLRHLLSPILCGRNVAKAICMQELVKLFGIGISHDFTQGLQKTYIQDAS